MKQIILLLILILLTLPVISFANIIRVEGAYPVDTNWTQKVDMAYDKGYEIRALTNTPDASGYKIIYEFNVPEAGNYDFWIVGVPPGEDWTSPIKFTLNGKLLDISPKNIGTSPKHELSQWVKLANVNLLKGKNELMGLVIERRSRPDTEYCYYIDEILFMPKDTEVTDLLMPLPAPCNIMPKDTSKNITIDLNKKSHSIEKTEMSLCQGGGIWDKGEMDAIIPALKALRPSHFRKDNLTPICKKVNGKWTYDFKEMDRLILDTQKMGCKFIACVEPGPECFEGIDQKEVFNYDAVTKYYSEVSRYYKNNKTIKIKYYEMLNEPDGRWWFKTHYFKFYKAAYKGIKLGDPNAIVGGPASIGPAVAYEFIKKCVENNVKVDFASYHLYGVSGDAYTKKALDFTENVRELTKQPNMPVFITEWGVTSTCCKYWWNSLGAGFAGSMYSSVARINNIPFTNHQFMIKDIINPPGADFGLFNIKNVPYPTYYAAYLFRLMKGNIVDLTGSTEENFGGIASSDNEKLYIYLWSLYPEGTNSYQVKINIQNAPKKYKEFKIAVIDPYCSNSYNKRQAYPKNNPLSISNWQPIKDLSFTMLPPGVTYIELR